MIKRYCDRCNDLLGDSYYVGADIQTRHTNQQIIFSSWQNENFAKIYCEACIIELKGKLKGWLEGK